MELVTLEDAKEYLRVDSSDEDALTGALLSASERLCADVARLSPGQWEALNADHTETAEEPVYTKEELDQIQPVMRVAILYALGYLYEHREEADHHGLTLTLRSLLFAIREGVL